VASRAHALKNPKREERKGSRGGNCLKGRTLAVPSVRGAPNISGSNEHHPAGRYEGPTAEKAVLFPNAARRSWFLRFGALNLLSTDGRDTGVVHERDFSIK
jgi:hypothetical protein